MSAPSRRRTASGRRFAAPHEVYPWFVASRWPWLLMTPRGARRELPRAGFHAFPASRVVEERPASSPRHRARRAASAPRCPATVGRRRLLRQYPASRRPALFAAGILVLLALCAARRPRVAWSPCRRARPYGSPGRRSVSSSRKPPAPTADVLQRARAPSTPQHRRRCVVALRLPPRVADRESGRLVMPNNRPQSKTSSEKDKASNKAVPAKKSASSKRFAERQAAKQEAARQERRARTRTYGIVTIALVVVIVGVLVIVKVAGGGSGSGTVDQASPPAGTPIPAATLAKLQSVPISTLGAAQTSRIVTSPQSVKGSSLVAGGKPELLFIGAEFCPHCAAERWPLYLALSKFGTFKPQPGRIHSANQEGDVPTLTFYGTTYTSPYLSFNPVEVYTNKPQGNGYAPLQTPTKAQLTLWQNTNGGSFPFIDFGGKMVLPSAQYLFTSLQNLPFPRGGPGGQQLHHHWRGDRRQCRPVDHDDLRLAFQPEARRRLLGCAWWMRTCPAGRPWSGPSSACSGSVWPATSRSSTSRRRARSPVRQRDRQLSEGHHELVFGGSRRAGSSARPRVLRRHAGVAAATHLASARAGCPDRPTGLGGGRARRSSLPSVCRTLLDRRHLPVVHLRARTHAGALRGRPSSTSFYPLPVALDAENGR